MLSSETNSIVDAYHQETYASASRTDDRIRHSLSLLLEDFSLADVCVHGFEDREWIN